MKIRHIPFLGFILIFLATQNSFAMLTRDGMLGDENVQFRVLSLSTLLEELRSRELQKASARLAEFDEGFSVQGLENLPGQDAALSNQSLLLEIPFGLLGQQNVFGAVITHVSDTKNEMLGNLKLTDLPPIHVKTVIANSNTPNPLLVLAGCVSNCTEDSNQQPLIGLPIVAVNEKAGSVVVDLAPLGKELNLVAMLDPNGDYTNLQPKSSVTKSFDYSQSTLVFDVESQMVPKGTTDANAPVTSFVVRWYLKLTSAFNPSFVARSPTKGVGFFTTERSADTKITRFSHTSIGTTAPVKYYVKFVPEQFKPAFKAGFDEWNEKLRPILGKNLLSYEFIDAGDPRADLLVAGDIRYNILEWDLVNKATYGGLGPSIAHQWTGEIFSANVLIQGPTIVGLYSDWFKVSQKIHQLEKAGRSAEALRLRRQLHRNQDFIIAKKAPTMRMSLGGKLDFRVNSQLPELSDAMMQRNDFDQLPPGQTYETYMFGYFREMVAHELGHNLGLRHNFRGNLGAHEGEPAEGKVTRSIMEYMGRGFRYLNRVGEYDLMAMAYGYKGKAPTQFDWFCTDDEATSPTNVFTSAECSRDDATRDPFHYLEERLKLGTSYLVARGQKTAPTWTIEDMKKELVAAVQGMASYAASSTFNSAKWTNFFGRPGRPEGAHLVKPYVVERIKAHICDPTLEEEAKVKETSEAQAMVLSNLAALRTQVATLASPYGIAVKDLDCTVSLP